MIWKVIDWLWDLLHRFAPEIPTRLPLKIAGVITSNARRERFRLALRHDLDWDNHYQRSKRKRGYWYSYRGNKRWGRLQIMDLVIEYRLGRK